MLQREISDLRGLVGSQCPGGWGSGKGGGVFFVISDMFASV